MKEILKISPSDIEKKSFEIISNELGERTFDKLQEPIIKRVIHTTADFDYADTLTFGNDAVNSALDAIKSGCTIVTDTQMAKSGINKAAAAKFGCEVLCFMSDEDVKLSAKENGTTRAYASMDKASTIENAIFAVGNAPTALIRLYELIGEGRISPKLIVGVPVGFVNVEAAKELIISTDVPHIVARGRKGGSNVAAAIINALLYMLDETRGG